MDEQPQLGTPGWCSCHGTWVRCGRCGALIDPHRGECENTDCLREVRKARRRAQLERKGSWICELCRGEFVRSTSAVLGHNRGHARAGQLVEMELPGAGKDHFPPQEVEARRREGWLPTAWQRAVDAERAQAR